MTSRKILVVVDPQTTDDQPVIERAAWLAAAAGAGLELFACDYDSDIDAGRVSQVFSIVSDARERVLSLHRERLETIAKPLRARGLDVSVEVVWDYPLAEAVIKKAAAHGPWLVAKDTAHHGVLQRTFLTHADWQLITHCPAPLLLVKPRPLGTPPKVLVAVDPTHEHDKPARLDDALFTFGDALAYSADAELHLVHAFAMPMAGVQLAPEVAGVVETEHRAALDRFLATHAVPRANVHLLQGLTHECLLRAAAEQKADFLIMGAIARRGVSKLLVGSTASRMLDRVPCDLVIVKTPGFEIPPTR
ncbi:MAG TPA: universal stress protein [Gammaproteobacteria bacterium]|nr:universal stress protein [Gammaproteobacteria bacterium]